MFNRQLKGILTIIAIGFTASVVSYELVSSNACPMKQLSIADEIKVKQFTPVHAFKQLELQAYKRQIMAGDKLRQAHFDLLSKLVTNTPVYEVTRPAAATTSEQLSVMLENLF